MESPEHIVFALAALSEVMVAVGASSILAVIPGEV